MAFVVSPYMDVTNFRTALLGFRCLQSYMLPHPLRRLVELLIPPTHCSGLNCAASLVVELPGGSDGNIMHYTCTVCTNPYMYILIGLD